MAIKIPQETALSICRKIWDENRNDPSSPQALRCRNCEACCGGSVIRSRDGGRVCCPVSQRYARSIAVMV